MSRTRVLFVDHEVRLSGGEQDLLDLIRALDPLKVEAHVVLPDEGPLAEAVVQAGAQLHVCSISKGLRSISRWELTKRPWLVITNLPGIISMLWGLGKTVVRIKPNLIHTNSMKSHLLMIVPAKLSRTPLVWHVRDILGPGWLRKIFSFMAWRFPLVVVCISKAVAEQFEGGAKDKTLVIYNGIDLRRFAGIDPKNWREKLGAHGSDPLIGIVGQIARWKGQDVFVEAAAKVMTSFPKARFAVIGECLYPQNESDYEAAIRARASELGLGHSLVWAGWSDEPEKVMAALDIVVHSSRRKEPFGRVIVEGMAAGKPVIASDEGAGHEIIESTEGRVIPAGNPEVLAHALTEILSNESLRVSMGLTAKTRAKAFDISHTARAVESLYEEIMGPQSAVGGAHTSIPAA